MFIVTRKIMGEVVKDKKGASAVEYAILVGCIGAVLATGAKSYGTSLSGKLSGLINTVNFTGP